MHHSARTPFWTVLQSRQVSLWERGTNHHHLLLIKELERLCQCITTHCQVELGFQGNRKSEALNTVVAHWNPRTSTNRRVFWKTNTAAQSASLVTHSVEERGIRLGCRTFCFRGEIWTEVSGVYFISVCFSLTANCRACFMAMVWQGMRPSCVSIN